MVKWWVVGLWVEYKNPSWPPSHKVYTVHSGEHTVLTLPPQVITAHIKSFSLIVPDLLVSGPEAGGGEFLSPRLHFTRLSLL